MLSSLQRLQIQATLCLVYTAHMRHYLDYFNCVEENKGE